MAYDDITLGVKLQGSEVYDWPAFAGDLASGILSALPLASMTYQQIQSVKGLLVSVDQAQKDLATIRDFQVTYEVAANGQWTCRSCGAEALFCNAIAHDKDCVLQKILGGAVKI